MVLTKEILKQKPLILAIDTSCDDTSVALLRGREVLNSELSSQTELHSEFGGVVPDLARRLHEQNIEEVYNRALGDNPGMINNVDYIAVTTGPGLAIDLEVGIKYAKELSLRYNKPLIPINHMEGHLFSSLLLNSYIQSHPFGSVNVNVLPFPIVEETDIVPPNRYFLIWVYANKFHLCL